MACSRRHCSRFHSTYSAIVIVAWKAAAVEATWSVSIPPTRGSLISRPRMPSEAESVLIRHVPSSARNSREARGASCQQASITLTLKPTAFR